MTLSLQQALYPKDRQFATKIGTGEFHDLDAMTPCTLIQVNAGDDYRQGGLFKAAGTFPEMYELYNQRYKGYSLHIRLPNGLYFPDDYIEHTIP